MFNDDRFEALLKNPELLEASELVRVWDKDLVIKYIADTPFDHFILADTFEELVEYLDLIVRGKQEWSDFKISEAIFEDNKFVTSRYGVTTTVKQKSKFLASRSLLRLLIEEHQKGGTKKKKKPTLKLGGKRISKKKLKIVFGGEE